mmetsp:Transcript_20334/g.33370  ORF Transcript_20334/g.33370 Transcript_20334/m.33370 type:complete len:415 (+) Transcript_20334:212-1456(+)|eukprot:CAMPEP_0184643364 /NCGR_PEP_ID=MMETSP0308-20130426/199_1 /TAXON_ID=38269 /ORGANISM="Gloeochaete witrockiana, Strain SAG 46.84" /LENGTH=414 /DNA_ID=CAMNT_0027071249 /DNA_START=186 /DNA_END=1430 /DNA_ORIENTATION=+
MRKPTFIASASLSNASHSKQIHGLISSSSFLSLRHRSSRRGNFWIKKEGVVINDPVLPRREFIIVNEASSSSKDAKEKHSGEPRTTPLTFSHDHARERMRKYATHANINGLVFDKNEKSRQQTVSRAPVTLLDDRGFSCRDLTKPEDNLRAWVKTRASLNPEDVIMWWEGDAHSYIPEERSMLMFKIEGFNISHMEQVDGGYVMISREIMFFKDPVTGQLLHEWYNPFTDTMVEVLPVLNDPVNLPFMLLDPRTNAPFKLPYFAAGRSVHWIAEVFPLYPSPLPKSSFPDNSSGDIYQSAELFTLISEKDDLEDESKASAGCQLCWTRISPWLPWMFMGGKPGTIIFQASGMKLSGFDELPAHIKAEVNEKYPKFKHSPSEFTSPNETSWSFYRKLFEKRRQAALEQDPSTTAL